ncbi:MAG: hypothetical protein KC506_03840 [Nanoarchaeota archaeon]|nr:hypothetical protein [Nanoarchaeota archaeon]
MKRLTWIIVIILLLISGTMVAYLMNNSEKDKKEILEECELFKHDSYLLGSCYGKVAARDKRLNETVCDVFQEDVRAKEICSYNYHVLVSVENVTEHFNACQEIKLKTKQCTYSVSESDKYIVEVDIERMEDSQNLHNLNLIFETEGSSEVFKETNENIKKSQVTNLNFPDFTEIPISVSISPTLIFSDQTKSVCALSEKITCSLK